MALPIIEDCFRVALIWNQIDGIRPVNVIHVACNGGSVTDVGESFFNAVQDDQFSPMPIGFQCDAVEVTPLDGVSGSTIVNAPMGTTIAGGQVAEGIAGEAMIVSFKTGLRGPAHRGRFFMGPVAENVCSGGTFDGDTVAIAGHWQDWSDAMRADTPQVDHVVASYVHSTFSIVSSYAVKAPLGSARRRLLQVR